jgi:hypothetical protein
MKPYFVAIFIVVLNASWNYKMCCHILTYKGLVGVIRDVSTTGIDSGIEICLIYTYVYLSDISHCSWNTRHFVFYIYAGYYVILFM